MIQCSVYVGTSLDGYIAREDGDIDWLNEANAVVPPGEDCGFAKFMSKIDALVMGRNTFEKVLSLGQWIYGDKPVIVMTRGDRPLPEGVPKTVSLTRESPHDLLARLEKAGHRRLYIDGGQTVQSFLAAGLIDDLTITVIPVLLGQGKPLFGPLSADVQLEHVATQVYEFGFVQHQYRVRPAS